MSLNLPEYIIKNYPFDLEKIYKNKLPKDMALTKKIYLAAIKQDRYIFSHLPEELIYDREICLAAVSIEGKLLYYVPRELRDKEMCLAAVKSSGQALIYVPHPLDREICFVAVANWRPAIKWVLNDALYDELVNHFDIQFDPEGSVIGTHEDWLPGYSG